MRSSVSCWSAPPPGCMGSLRARRQWFSTFLKLWPFNAVPHVMLIPRLKTLSLWLLNCNLATVTRHNVNIYVFWWFYVTLWKGHLTPRSCDSQVENHCHRPWMRLCTQELSIFISSFLVFFLFTPLLPSLPFPYLFFPSYSFLDLAVCIYQYPFLSLRGEVSNFLSQEVPAQDWGKTTL